MDGRKLWTNRKLASRSRGWNAVNMNQSKTGFDITWLECCKYEPIETVFEASQVEMLSMRTNWELTPNQAHTILLTVYMNKYKTDFEITMIGCCKYVNWPFQLWLDFSIHPISYWVDLYRLHMCEMFS